MVLSAAYSHKEDKPIPGLLGEITMFFGDISVFPTQTHALCDGNNGTPDLRGQFIRGWSDTVGQEYPGSPARINNYQSAMTAKPITEFSTGDVSNTHTHGSSDGGEFLTDISSLGAENVGTGSTPAFVGENRVSATTGESTSHTHIVTNGGDIETRPKNFSLAHIMRIA